MSDVVVTVPARLWRGWLDEGDWPGQEAGYESHFWVPKPLPRIEPDERVYIPSNGIIDARSPRAAGNSRGRDTVGSKPPMQRQYTPAFQERFQRYVEMDDDSGCWIWTGHTAGGYGRITVGRRGEGLVGAHVAAWEIACGEPVPSGWMVGHTCDIKLCVRNDGAEGTYEVAGVMYRRFGHLWLATPAANSADMVAKGREASGNRSPSRLHADSRPRGDSHPLRQHPELAARGERVGGARLTEGAVREIRARAAAGESMRHLATVFGVDRRTITFVVRRRTWSWLT